MARLIGPWLLVLAIAVPISRASGDEPSLKPRDMAREAGSRIPSLVVIAPGTAVGETLPAGWNHLVIKSVPTLVSGEIATLPAVAKSTATMFRSVLLADVRQSDADGAGFELRRVGVGLCVPIRGVDTAVTSSSLSALHVSLGFIERQVLRRAEEETAKGRIRGRTPTFALYSAPVTLKVGRSHVPVLLRYALLVDPKTGALRTLVWPLREDATARKPPRGALLLQPNLSFRCGLDVQTARLLGAVPASWSFAMAALPPGHAIALSPAAQPLAMRDRLTAAESARLEAELRTIPKLFSATTPHSIADDRPTTQPNLSLGRAH
jgi:hypothetical protein